MINMFINASTPVDRYSAAHEHFGSAGLSAGKIILILVLVCALGALIYYALKNDK